MSNKPWVFAAPLTPKFVIMDQIVPPGRLWAAASDFPLVVGPVGGRDDTLLVVGTVGGRDDSLLESVTVGGTCQVAGGGRTDITGPTDGRSAGRHLLTHHWWAGL